MHFWHASKDSFWKPKSSYFKDEKDFGPRLYCSDNLQSAQDFCDSRGCQYIMDFEFDIDNADSYGLTVRYFDPDYMTESDIADWIREIIANRAPDAALRNIDQYDYIPENIVVGPRADDDIQEILIEMMRNNVDMLDNYIVASYYEKFKLRRYDIQYCFDEDACDAIFYGSNGINMNIGYR